MRYTCTVVELYGCSRKPRLHHTEISSLSEVPVSCWSSSRARASASQKVVREAAAEPVERKGSQGGRVWTLVVVRANDTEAV